MTIEYKDSKRISALSTNGSGTTVTESSINDVSHFEGTVGANYVIGEQITGGTLVGKTITSLSFYLYQLSSGSGGTDTTFTFGIWNSSGVLQKEFGSVNRSSLPIGSAFGDAVKFTGTATDSGYELQTNDVIGLRTNTNPASAWTVEIGMDTTNPYSDGQRALFVQGSSPAITSARDIPFEAVYGQDLKPTNVQDNSILVEKDTGNRYWFSDPPTFQDDFSSADNWVDVGSNVGVNTSTDVIDWSTPTGSSQLDLTSHDLVTVNNTKWVFRFKLVIDNLTQGSSTEQQQLAIGLSDGNQTIDGTESQKFNGLRFQVNNSSKNIRHISFDGGNPFGAGGSIFSTAISETTFYIELKGDGSTSFTASLYSDSDYSALIETATRNPLTPDMRYIKIYSQTEGSSANHTFNGTIDDVEFYNDTVTPATWTQEWNGSPNSVADLQGWWDASASDSTISLLVDKSGNGYNLTQGTSARQPSVVSGAQNSLNALQFAPNTGSGYASEMMQNTSMPNAKSQTIFYVAKVTKTTSGDAGYNYYIWDTSSNDNYNGMTQRQDTWRIYAGNSVDVTETTWGVWRNLTMKYDGSNSILRDRGSQETVALTLEGSTDTGFTLNGYANGGDYGGTQDFGELIVYNRALTDTEIANVESYLTTKWGL